MARINIIPYPWRMVWVDRIVGEIKERFAEKISKKQTLVIRDEKTLSGRVHIGSLRGIAIHGLIAEVLSEQKIANVFRFELNDFDPMDEIPRTLERSTYENFMGQPLYTVPPHEKTADTYPLVFGTELQEVVKQIGFPLEYYRLEPEYKAGKFNEVIAEALNHAAEIRAIYKEVSGSVKPDDWFPLQVICERCGKVGTTQVTSWDPSASSGQAGSPGLVTYHCKEDLVKWAKGCGNQGTVSPFDGNAKLPWKVEWPAKWKVFGVDIEGAGKDHSAAGGSREIGKRIAEEVFHYPEPFDIPYEFFNIGGKKMSASKGLGASAKEISDLLPPTQLRLLMIRKLPNQPIDFDPEGTTIPTLFDEYDRLADHEFKRHDKPEPDFGRIFELSQRDFPKKPQDIWHMRFSLAAFLAQMPHLNAVEEAEQLTGGPLNPAERKNMEERIEYAKKWIEEYAPEKFRFVLEKNAASDDPKRFAPDVAKALGTLLKNLEGIPHNQWTGPTIHETIHKVKEELKIQPKILFEPIYQMFLNRSDGPQAGWFLSTLKRDDVLKRMKYYTN